VATTLTVERLAPGGEGFSRAGPGPVVFVPGGLPGDRVLPERLERHRGFLRAVSFRLVTPSPDRVEPPCPFADACGGCDLMRLARPAQLRAKAELLADALRRTGRLGAESAPPTVVTAGGDLGYRHRARLHVDAGGRVGFYGRRAHDLVTIDRCVVCSEPVSAGLAALHAAGPGALGPLESIELRAAPRGTPLVAVGTPRPGAGAAALRALTQTLDGLAAVWVAGASTGEAPEQRFPLPGELELRVGPETFTQVNWTLNLQMVRDVVARAVEHGVQGFSDLYAGAGNFALPLLAAGMTGLVVERSAEAVARARASARAAGLSGGEFRVGRAEVIARRLAAERSGAELVLLDPPRAGARAALPGVLAARPRFVALIACDPPTFARDVRTLREHGYALQELAAYDLFPHTHHVEAVAWLVRT